jgi:hypothetical protein
MSEAEIKYSVMHIDYHICDKWADSYLRPASAKNCRKGIRTSRGTRHFKLFAVWNG